MFLERPSREIALLLGLNAAHVDVVVQRWQTLSGKQATLYGSGRTFDEVKTERMGVAA